MFLCKSHKQKLLNESPERLREISRQWSEQAAMHYQFSRYDVALPYAGCAMEVCWMEAEKSDSPSLVLLTQTLCLAIYCFNLLSHLKDEQSGYAVLAMSWKHFSRFALSLNDPEMVKQYLILCKDNEQHESAIEQHTTWPFEPVEQTVSAILH
jgi:hypothetical protein